MALKNQIHLYSLDTSCFYNDKEKAISDKLNKWYPLRSKIRKKYNEKKYVNTNIYKHQLKRINKIINAFKNMLIAEFENTKNKKTIRNLRTDVLNDKKVVSIFESNLNRTLKINNNELTKKLAIIQVYYFQVAKDLVVDGFMWDNEKYVLFSSSAGQIRTKKFVVIKESELDKAKNTLTCGLNWDIINSKGGVNANKYLSYYSLANSATDILKGFNIDKSIVVDDFETIINSEVDFIDDITYEITRKYMDVPIPHTDGSGIKLYGNNEMIRLPWIKGLMGTFDYRGLILHWREKYKDNTIGIIKDIYNKQHDIIIEDIQYIFTKSQFKMWKYYESWESYKENFKKYKCEACVCNTEEEYIKDAKINYQMLQTLSDMTDEEIVKLSQRTIYDINNIGNDYRTMMKILGVTKYNQNKSYMQQAIEVYPELMRDKYNRQILKDCKTSLVKDGKSGKISINGKYTFVLPDLYAFCEWLFLKEKNPKGLLSNGEVSCNLYKDKVELDCLRSPHLYKEHAVRKNIHNDMTDRWFKGNAIYTSTRDLISKYLMFDVDGDKLLVVADKLLCKIAKRNMTNVVPLYYDMKKASSQHIDSEVLFDGLEEAYKGGNIGIYSNNISKIYNSGKIGQKELDVIKLLCMENNFVIDMAKTLYMPKRPKKISNLIKSYTKLNLPYFFKYAKNKKDYQINKPNNSTVNKLDYIIPNPALRINKTIGKIDIGVLLSDNNFVTNEQSDDVIKCYDYWNIKKRYMIRDKKKYKDMDKEHSNEEYVYSKIRNNILELPYEKDFIVNSLVFFLYTNRKSSDKKTLWECFGEEILCNIKNKAQSFKNICPMCGKRFILKKHNQVYCSKKCYEKSNVLLQSKRNNM